MVRASPLREGGPLPCENVPHECRVSDARAVTGRELRQNCGEQGSREPSCSNVCVAAHFFLRTFGGDCAKSRGPHIARISRQHAGAEMWWLRSPRFPPCRKFL